MVTHTYVGMLINIRPYVTKKLQWNLSYVKLLGINVMFYKHFYVFFNYLNYYRVMIDFNKFLRPNKEW